MPRIHYDEGLCPAFGFSFYSSKKKHDQKRMQSNIEAQKIKTKSRAGVGWGGGGGCLSDVKNQINTKLLSPKKIGRSDSQIGRSYSAKLRHFLSD